MLIAGAILLVIAAGILLVARSHRSKAAPGGIALPLAGALA